MNPVFPLLAALLLSTSSAMAGNWHVLQNTSHELLEAGEPQLEASEDNNQVKTGKKDKKLKTWGKITFSRPEQAKPGDYYYSSAKSLLAINCTQRTYRLLQKIYYAADGQEIKSVHYGEDEKNKFIVPDSVEERVSDFSCAFKPAKAANKTPRRAQQPKSDPPEENPVISSKEAQKSEPKTVSNSKSTNPKKPPATKPKDSAAEKAKR